MSKSRDVLYEGWLTKSPPTKRIWRGRWRRRWFVLHPGDLPQQFRLAYYTDRSCRKVKGIIDLDHCDQVDIGFKFEDKKVKFDFMFAIKTQPRTYYLAADSDMELRSWVKCICDVCGLKPTNEDDEAIQIIEEKPQSTIPIEIHNTLPQRHILESPPISPVSTSPYIPISECITGKSPLLPKDHDLCKRLLQNSYDSTQTVNNQIHANVSYETATYLNCTYRTAYETPRGLLPHRRTTNKTSDELSQRKNSASPLQSPVGSDNVFTDENWTNHTISQQSLRNIKLSDSFEDIMIAQKLTKLHVDPKSSEDTPKVPPRPPKPAHIHQGSSSSSDYFNISAHSTLTKPSKDNKDYCNSEDMALHVTSDEMYDFPRSHQLESDVSQSSTMKRHCYNNAAPVICQDGQVFKYDASPKAGTSAQVFVYDMDDANDEVPPSPSSQGSYYNLPSPSLPDAQLMSPPAVNRCLKPRRKISTTSSISSTTEPSSPRLAPSIDRKLKPVSTGTSSQKVARTQSSHVETHYNLRKIFEADTDTPRKIRAAPSPTPKALRRSHDSLITDSEQLYFFSGSDNLQNYHKLEYLDLDLDIKASQFSAPQPLQPARSPGANTVYKKVDFMKTEAFNKTRHNLEKERNARCE